MQQEYPILEFDSAPEAILEPKRLFKPIDAPEHAVVCFFQDVITQLSQQHKATVIRHLRSEIGTHPLYELDIEGRRLAVFHPGVGAPLAAGILEEVIALGCKKFIACGGAGVLFVSLPPTRPGGARQSRGSSGYRNCAEGASVRVYHLQDVDHRRRLS